MMRYFAAIIFFATAFAAGANAQTTPPQLPQDLPTDYATIGGLLYLAEAAEACGFRSEDWTKAVAKDAGNASDKFLNGFYPAGVPPSVKLDAEAYDAQEMQAGAGVHGEPCQTLLQSGLLAIGDAAAQNDEN